MRASTRLAAALLCGGLAAAGVAAGGPAAASAAPGGLVLYVHPGGGGGWTSHAVHGVDAGAAPPSIGAVHGEVVLAERDDDGDVTVAEGSIFGAFTAVDLSTTASAPQAAGQPVVATTGGVVSVWYRTTFDTLEVATQPSSGAPWALTDVTSITSGPPVLGDPFVLRRGSGWVGYAVVASGIVEAFTPPHGAAGWVQSDPTNGLAYPALTGDVAVFDAPGAPAATVVLATTQAGDVVELSNQLDEPYEAVGPWRSSDLTELGAPAASSGLSAFGGSTPYATYDSWGSAVALTLTSGLVGGFSTENLTNVDQLWPSGDVAPTLVHAPSGPSVATPSSIGDLLVASITSPTKATDVSYERHTGEFVSSSVASTLVGRADVLVADDAGPIAPSPLRRRIAMLATSFDQQHLGYLTNPMGSDCNRFTASFGRGSTYGCPNGTSSEEWCSDFAQYIWAHAGVPTRGISGWAASFITWGALHHLVQMGTHFTPKVGDAIVWGQRTPLYGTHVAIIVSVDGSNIDVVSGNSPSGFIGDGVGVWRWGPFDGATSTVNGYPVLGVVTP